MGISLRSTSKWSEVYDRIFLVEIIYDLCTLKKSVEGSMASSAAIEYFVITCPKEGKWFIAFGQNSDVIAQAAASDPVLHMPK